MTDLPVKGSFANAILSFVSSKKRFNLPIIIGLRKLLLKAAVKLQKTRHAVDSMSRPTVWAVQLVIFALSGIGAFLLRFDLTLPSDEMAHLAYALPVWILVKSVFREMPKSSAARVRFPRVISSVSRIIRVSTPRCAALTASTNLLWKRGSGP